ncbi:RNA-binding protein 1-like isoform X2 [Macadamia integrifolia]|uniref:RNA-binding protein 1-like isoform X2 n=1 Tax=Macadamia integrifolia TaxID=60698 RepID=UPI001C52B78E|nr:RNA-binding protein 1-like isoform X2 [Macadamia integrifolia]XP_042480770.1 RNA-binding protein 1-like isoform X2 [Macadamia integrifolia]
MADGYWRYGDARQAPMPSLAGKRSRSDYDVPGGHEFSSYFPRDDERGGPRVNRDTESINASYDRYLRQTQMSSYGGGESGRPMSAGMTGHPVDDPRMMTVGGIEPGMAGKGRNMGFGGGRPEMSLPPVGGIEPGLAGKSRNMGFGGGRPEMALPPDASNTLFVEGLPANCTRREVSHIFRPFVGFREVRLVSKESRHPGGEPLVLCFVDFATPAQAATALDALQGYKFDEHDRDSANLRLQFARYPGPRSGGGPRSRR